MLLQPGIEFEGHLSAVARRLELAVVVTGELELAPVAMPQANGFVAAAAAAIVVVQPLGPLLSQCFEQLGMISPKKMDVFNDAGSSSFCSLAFSFNSDFAVVAWRIPRVTVIMKRRKDRRKS